MKIIIRIVITICVALLGWLVFVLIDAGVGETTHETGIVQTYEYHPAHYTSSYNSTTKTTTQTYHPPSWSVNVKNIKDGEMYSVSSSDNFNSKYIGTKPKITYSARWGGITGDYRWGSVETVLDTDSNW